ncbi:Hypothetical protein, putative [Bodo saltans]|uniref:GINS subunit domain-containing protein n=1 Tax=Bodo saltans TaxID=75058 RepID=A0A0S4JLR8_BODSA|nr:Hypothetical protein, putative [Bodo saltans]|eukprot:CUG92474.1 Hypothetical protein, putative [Bodo saltans]
MIRTYFDVNDVLLDEQPVPVVFATPCFSIAKDIVTRTAEGERIQEIDRGARATMPMWAVAPLRKSGYVQVNTVPQEFQNVTFREFKMDPLAPNLRAKSPFFYDHGVTIAALLSGQHERVRLRNQLTRLFQVRFYPILNATAKKGHDFQDLRDSLTDSEQRLLKAVWESEVTERQWARSAQLAKHR